MKGRQVGFRLSPENEARYQRDKKLYGHKTFDDWLTALLARENLYRITNRHLLNNRRAFEVEAKEKVSGP